MATRCGVADRPVFGRAWWWWCCLILACSAAEPTGAVCGACATGSPAVAAFLCPLSGSMSPGAGCGGFPSCQTPVLSGPSFDVFPQGNGQYTVQMRVDVTAPGNGSQDNPSFWPQVFWYSGATAPPPGSGNVCSFGQYDKASTYVERQNVTCSGGDFGTYSLRVTICQGFFTSCAPAALKEGMAFVVPAGSLPGCGEPPPVWGCGDDASCSVCTGPGGSASPAGGGPGWGGPGTGPDAFLYYRAGGVGRSGFPGSAAWTPALGRYWSHTHAERIVLDPDDSHVWLLTRFATFREFSGLSGGIYATVHPSDEYRKLARTATGWELRELDGGVHVFDSGGLWLRTVDRDGNATVATYTAGRLTAVTFPNGRSETYAYGGSGKLATITDIGLGGAATRVWTYTWSGDDLVRIDRPDGTALEFRYDDPRFPGYMTRRDLIGKNLTRRIEAAWEYDVAGNVARTWRGDPAATGPNAVDVYTLSYDNPALPAVTQVTDPLGKTTTYTLGRDAASRKPKLAKLDGDCPACSAGPNEQRFYADPAHPLLPTRTLDGRGLETQYAYNANGRLTSKTEAAGTPRARTTAWQYGDAAHPAFPTRIDQPSTAGGSAVRSTVLSYNAAGDLQTRTIQGAEAGGSFTLSTVTSYNAAGQPLTVDPPGRGRCDLLHLRSGARQPPAADADRAAGRRHGLRL